jgi:bacterioferritin (cytochrome b1)
VVARSRRAFFRGAGITFVAGAPVFIAACGGGDDGGAAASRQGGSVDVDVLNAALDLEFTIAAAYRAGARLLKGEVRAVGEQFLAQAEEHADALTRAIKDLGGTPSKPKPGYDFPTLANQTDVLTFATELENTAVAAYIDAVPKLTDGRLRGTVAAIVTNEAEHISVLLGALGKPQVPEAFVTGREA